MGKVHLKLPPFFACMIDQKTSDWFVLEREIGKETTVGNLLTDLASSRPEFRKVVFNPDAGIVGDQLDIVLNRNLLYFPHEMDTKLSDGDEVILLPVYAGG